MENRNYYIYIYLIVISLAFSSSNIKIKSPKNRSTLKIGENHTIKWKINKKLDNSEKLKIYFLPTIGLNLFKHLSI